MNLLFISSALVVLGLAGCKSLNSPISGSSFDPLLPPGGALKPAVVTRPGFQPGDHVSSAMDGAAFFKQLPKGDADAEKTLAKGTRMKVISVDGSYLKVELDAAGEVGYVPAIMVVDPNLQPAEPPPPPPNTIQVYPPAPGAGSTQPAPPVGPASSPPPGASLPGKDGDAQVPVTPKPE